MVISSLLLLLLMCMVWGIVFFTGGTKYVYLHLMYIPILISAFLFKVKGGIISAIIAGVLLGPFMPLDVENNIGQPFIAYIYRTTFFILIGGLVGFMARWLNIRLLMIQETLDDMSLVYARTLKNYASMVSVRDEQTSFHCERVAYNAILIGEKLGLADQKLEALYWSGLLHDLGKIGIKESILLKPGKLTVEEFAEMKRHTEIGYNLLMSLSSDMNLVAKGVRSHHEKWNGSGYPDGLKGDEIPIFGRILCVVDVFEALTSERPYKAGWDPKEAMQYIEEHKDSHFDAKLVDVFNSLYKEEKIWISNNPMLDKEIEIPKRFNKEKNIIICS